MNRSQRDAVFMKKALALARRGGRAVRPNPRVGAVLTKGGRVIASGYHAFFGGPHAEVVALNRAGKRARGATLFVTLEPCSTCGKTPPCVGLIIERGIRRVVIGCRDENPVHRGRAFRILRRAGIPVRSGVLAGECWELNRDFFTWVTRRRPYSILKLAVSLDGKIATRSGHSRWISSRLSRERAHYLRGRADAVLVGVNTVLRDDPRLTVRMGYRHPSLIKVVVDSRGRIPLSSRLLRGAGVTHAIVATAGSAPPGKMSKLVGKGGTWLRLPAQDGRVNLPALFRELARRNIMRILIEGGSGIAASALEEGLVDEIHLFIAPIIIGGREAVPAIGGEGVRTVRRAIRVTKIEVSRTGPDIYIKGRVGHH